MVTDFSGTSILSNEFVIIGRASTDNLGYFWVRAPNVAHVATGGKKWRKKQNLNGIRWSLDLFAIGLVSNS